MALCVGFDEEKVQNIHPEASMIKAMEIWQLPKNKRGNLKEYCDGGQYLASLKRDGYFYWLNKTPQYAYLFSRKAGVSGFLTEKSKNVPHLFEAAQNLPADTLIAGEVYVPGKTSKGVTRIMGCLPPKAIERQEAEGYVHYYLIDIVMLAGEDLRDKPFEERIEILQEVYVKYFVDNEYISLAENIDTDIYDTAVALMEQGEEGMVLKKKDSLYECGKRPAWSSIKIKQENTLDVVITGFCAPTKEYAGKNLGVWEYWIAENPTADNMDLHEDMIPVTKAYYYGWKNAIEVSAYNKDGELEKIGTISSGLTDELRKEFAENPEKYLNTVVEIKCMSVDAADHSIRHGYLLKFRDDKNPEDCTFSQIFS